MSFSRRLHRPRPMASNFQFDIWSSGERFPGTLFNISLHYLSFSCRLHATSFPGTPFNILPSLSFLIMSTPSQLVYLLIWYPFVRETGKSIVWILSSSFLILFASAHITILALPRISKFDISSSGEGPRLCCSHAPCILVLVCPSYPMSL